MYRYDNYTDSFVRIDGEPHTGSTTVRVGVPLKESMIVQKTELTDECINRIADAVVRKLADLKTESQNGYQTFNGTSVYVSRLEDEPQMDCQDCKYVWWNSEAKRYECSVERCPYNEPKDEQSGKE